MTIDELLEMIGYKKELTSNAAEHDVYLNGMDVVRSMIVDNWEAIEVEIYERALKKLNDNRVTLRKELLEAQQQAAMRPKLKVAIHSFKGRSTGKHQFCIEGLFPLRMNSVEESKADATEQLNTMGFEPEFFDD